MRPYMLEGNASSGMSVKLDGTVGRDPSTERRENLTSPGRGREEAGRVPGPKEEEGRGVQ